MILLLLYSLSSLDISLAAISCMVNNEQCRVGDNLIKTSMGAHNMEECSNLCKQVPGCTAFTYFGAKSHLLSEACMLFNSCRQHGVCEDCITGKSQDDCTCSIPYQSVKNIANFEKLLVNIEDEFECKKLCKKSMTCKAYTYFNGNHAISPLSCVLLTSHTFSGGNGWECQHCFTGPDHCEAGQECKVRYLSTSIPALVDKSLDICLVTGEKDCFIDLNAVAIGSGGRGTYHSKYGYGTGGGSGYFKNGSLRLTSKNDKMEMKIGAGWRTTVTIGGTVVLKAYNGDVGYSGEGGLGGDGYSGGGGVNEAGGSAGGNGIDGVHSSIAKQWWLGGKGSGEDVTLLNMKHFKFTPGKGGPKGMGGGGGGVMVNGKGPEESMYMHLGEGYGAGGGDGNGHTGCVALEFS